MQVRIEFSSTFTVSLPSLYYTTLLLIGLPKTILSAGGGFTFPAAPEYFLFLRALQKDVSASCGDVGIAVLEYCESRQIPARIALYYLFDDIEPSPGS